MSGGPNVSPDEATQRAGRLDTDPADPAATVLGNDEPERNQELSVRRGAAVGRYLVVERLGSGAMGVVFRAYDPDLDRAVALKLVATDELAATAADGERSRLMREAQAIARLSHPNVVTVYDVGTVGESVYVAMEYIAGVTLRGWKDEEHTLEETLEVFAQAGRGLAAAHRAGLVHRDFKPDNVMIVRPTDDPSTRVRVLDFGLARMESAHAASDDEGRQLADSHRSDPPHTLSRSMTAAGTVMGTPAYMSPEQHLGQTATAASDQFSFCIALFEALYGRRPFAGNTIATLATNVMAGLIETPEDAPAIPGHVRDAVDRGLSTNPEERFASMDQLLAALRPRRRGRNLRWIVAGLGGAVAASAVTLSMQDEEPPPPPTPCQGAAPKMAEVWNSETRQRLATDFEATRRAYATDVWTATASILDERADAWIAGHTDACEATRVRGEQSTELLDLRIACYDGQLRRTGALLEALQDPDDDTLRSAIDAALALPPVERCADLEALGKSPAAAVPPQHEEVVASVVGKLDATATQLNLGHYDTAAEAFGSALEDARSVDHSPTLARALWLHAELVSSKGDTKAGVAASEEAFAELSRQGTTVSQATLPVRSRSTSARSCMNSTPHAGGSPSAARTRVVLAANPSSRLRCGRRWVRSKSRRATTPRPWRPTSAPCSTGRNEDPPALRWPRRSTTWVPSTSSSATPNARRRCTGGPSTSRRRCTVPSTRRPPPPCASWAPASASRRSTTKRSNTSSAPWRSNAKLAGSPPGALRRCSTMSGVSNAPVDVSTKRSRCTEAR